MASPTSKRKRDDDDDDDEESMDADPRDTAVAAPRSSKKPRAKELGMQDKKKLEAAKVNARFKSGDNQSESVLVPLHQNAGKPPPYNADAKARDVFSNPFFYQDQLIADAVRQRREQVLKDMTIGEVHRKYVVEYPRGKQQGLKDFADLISARNSGIEAFLDPSEEPVEDTLSRMKTIDLTNTKDLAIYDKNRIKELPSAHFIWLDTSSKKNSEGKLTRVHPLCLVLGPSGSGKTFFALEYLTDFMAPSEKKLVTVYLHPGDYEDIKYNEDNLLAAKQLIDKIRQECSNESRREDMPEKLDMHVCLVFDEAGSSYTKAWFESTAALNKLCREARRLASSVTVVVVGTGLTGRKLSSTNDAYVFRMKPWETSDISKLLEKTKLRVAERDNIDTVARAIFAHPKLGALATNGRSAFFLAKAVTRLSSRYSRVSWDLQLNEWAAALVTQVVDGYISLNGINELKINERRRVAASVFRAVQKMKKGDTSLPTFSELEEREIPVAESLLQYNLERGVEKLQIVPEEGFAFTITPALVLVLYAMAGIYTTLVPGWRNGEELAALYAVRQSIVQCMERFVSDLSKGLSREECQTELDESLDRIRLVRLQKKLQSKFENVYVPMVEDGTIMMNGEIASFADVIAKRILIQAKHTKDPSELFPVKLYEELKKCGLVNEEDCYTRLLRGLMVIWQNKIDMESIQSNAATATTSSSRKKAKVQRYLQESKAFPENVLSIVPSMDPIRYAVIKGKTATTMTLDDDATEIPLPLLDGTTIITFILSTNADRLNLDLGPSLPKVIISEANVDVDMEIDVATLKDSDKSAWTTFVNEQMREGVLLKFLFTT